ncbi:chromate efflux transporter [Mycobacterium avium]|uniref:chromate efflux transporter n=1 Tax=Mycobacterium avium TaxID=1764 RepID=UPI0015CA9BBC|nr:chromate efflux transporter [Mycobacterium avium]
MTEADPQPPADRQRRSTDAESASAPGFGRILAYFLKLGAIGFGGPIATVGYMQRDLVEQRQWIDRQDFLDGVALGQTMPGPLAAQVAMWVGYLRRGALGAAAVAAAFVAPAFVIVVAVGAIYSHYSGSRVVQALFYGIAPAVMAIITIAAIKLIKLTDRSDWRLWSISAAVFALTALTGSEPVLVIVGAGLLMILLDARPRIRLPHRKPPDGVARTDDNPKPMPMVIGLGTIVSGGKLASLALFFLKTGAIVFGSGLAIVPFMRAGVVDQHHWLTNSQFLDSVAIGLITPGPVVISAGFIGYLVAGLPGAIVSALAIFTPIYLGVVVPGRWFLRHRDNAQVRAFVAGATAAAGGALCGAVVVLTRQAVTDWITATIAVVTLGMLWRFKIKEPYVVVATGALGVLLF